MLACPSPDRRQASFGRRPNCLRFVQGPSGVRIQRRTVLCVVRRTVLWAARSDVTCRARQTPGRGALSDLLTHSLPHWHNLEV